MLALTPDRQKLNCMLNRPVEVPLRLKPVLVSIPMT
jgi:hypothetical protein